MNVLVTGGAGYVGSHVLPELRRAGHNPVVFDNLSEGHRRAVADTPFIKGDLASDEQIADALARSRADAVMHFAARAYVGESVEKPQEYYFNNVAGALRLLRAMLSRGVKRLVFSSSCCIYGVPQTVPITEDFRIQPINPYGRTKAIVEDILSDYARAYGLRYASLRYFNASGAAADGSIGEDHDPETHLIPIAIQAALGRRDGVSVYGSDYPTPDGTCIRDYVHVLDLATAHVMALEALEDSPVQIFNLSTGQGHSVREVIQTVKQVAGRDFKVEEAPRRHGDAPALVGSSERIRAELGWQPRSSSLDEIITSAWRWHSAHPDGFQEEKG
ncbi:MAG: UDP-glucose 4-epimerase GalE [Planctomycetes bacterium]|nr:UDP-glucose 4-epimerase GalE [Planctomycetota bacterium]